MARKTDRQLVAELLERYEPGVKAAFLDAVADLRDNASLRVLADMLERGDIGGAIESLGLDDAAFARLELAIAETYNGSGLEAVENYPAVREPDGARVIWRFGVRDLEGVAWLRGHSATLVTRILDDQRQAIRQHLTDGLARGDNPRVTATELIGRVDRSSNRRTGGIIGLTAPQERYLASARQELLSGDPEAMRHYLTRGRRDRRFDRAVMAAIRDERPLDGDMVSRATGRYADRLLQLRGEMLAQNETQEAIAKAREDAIRQQIRAGKIDQQDVVKVWHHLPQEKPRLHHRAMNGKSVPLDQDFVLQNGARMKYPHAPDAPVSEKVGCKCTHSLKVDFFASVVRRHRQRAA